VTIRTSVETLPLFVFGTLRRGEANHNCLAGTYDNCLAATLRNFKRAIAEHGYPAVVRSPGDEVIGELYFIRPDMFAETLRRCDLLEDIPAGELIGRYYQRASVVVDTAEGQFAAWAYIAP